MEKGLALPWKLIYKNENGSKVQLYLGSEIRKMKWKQDSFTLEVK